MSDRWGRWGGRLSFARAGTHQMLFCTFHIIPLAMFAFKVVLSPEDES